MDVYENLRKYNITLPEIPVKNGTYVPIKQVGNLLYTSGVGPVKGGVPIYTGRVGEELDLETAREAAELAMLNIMSNLENYLGDLNKIKNVVKILGFVSSSNSFVQQAKVMNGASDLLIKIFGDNGNHTRTAIGTNVLPRNMSVEIECIFEI